MFLHVPIKNQYILKPFQSWTKHNDSNLYDVIVKRGQVKRRLSICMSI